MRQQVREGVHDGNIGAIGTKGLHHRDVEIGDLYADGESGSLLNKGSQQIAVLNNRLGIRRRREHDLNGVAGCPQ